MKKYSVVFTNTKDQGIDNIFDLLAKKYGVNSLESKHMHIIESEPRVDYKKGDYVFDSAYYQAVLVENPEWANTMPEFLNKIVASTDNSLGLPKITDKFITKFIKSSDRNRDVFMNEETIRDCLDFDFVKPEKTYTESEVRELFIKAFEKDDLPGQYNPSNGGAWDILNNWLTQNL